MFGFLFVNVLGFLHGYGSKLNHQGTAGFSPCYHLPGFHFGYTFLTQSHMTFCFMFCHGLFGQCAGISTGHFWVFEMFFGHVSPYFWASFSFFLKKPELAGGGQLQRSLAGAGQAREGEGEGQGQEGRGHLGARGLARETMGFGPRREHGCVFAL